MHDQENNDLIARWEQAYGSTFVYKGFVGGCRLMTTDPVAIAYILRNAYDYPKPDFVRESLATMAAGHHGLLVVEGDEHRRQRKILTPAFSSAHIKTLTPIFWQKAVELRDNWRSFPAHTQIDALSWLSRATLDIIGLAGFGYKFESLASSSAPTPSSEFAPGSHDKEPNELSAAFAVIFSTARKFRAITILQAWFPFLRKFRRNSETMRKARATMRKIGLQLIDERQEQVLEELHATHDPTETIKPRLGRDLLSVLIRSNNATSAKERMSSLEILSQISTFIAAGHETTASGLSWCLFALAQHPQARQRLRQELRELDAKIPRCDCFSAQSSSQSEPQSHHRFCDFTSPEHRLAIEEALGNCKYLDWIIRESLRLHAPITSTMRVCMRDEDEVPVSGPLGPGDLGGYVDCEGNRRFSVKLRKHDIITIPIQAINKSKRLWGEDASVFRPERWEDLPDAVKLIPGLFAHTLTFLNGNGTMTGGNRGCIGWKFALTEIQILLYVLLRDMDIFMDPAVKIEKKVNIVTRPMIQAKPELGNQMPIYVHVENSSDEDEGALHGNKQVNGQSARSISVRTKRTDGSAPAAPKPTEQRSEGGSSFPKSSCEHKRDRRSLANLFPTPFD